ncbi:HK97-gp10 family putative phage morphogenesis protein [Enterococcus avium]|uniref:HK97-gp10 family putative phage morphogenesis protein n=1 Tax=Enterococcus avium TaxID=33945 RepID=UPI001F57BD66|nr:HK97-gp10 family putative phage morphogenesis protein [Enterococcus avium]
MSDVQVDWGNLDKNIAKCIADVKGPIRRKAGKTAGWKLGEALESNTPVDSHGLEIATTVGAVAENGDILIGYGSTAYWRAHFVNMGTEYQAGQHFVEKTVEQEAENAMRVYMDEIKRGLGL